MSSKDKVDRVSGDGLESLQRLLILFSRSKTLTKDLLTYEMVEKILLTVYKLPFVLRDCN